MLELVSSNQTNLKMYTYTQFDVQPIQKNYNSVEWNTVLIKKLLCKIVSLVKDTIYEELY